MTIISEKIYQLLAAAILLLFVAAVFLSFALMDFSMAMNSDGSMSPCPFMASGSLCSMNFQEHLSLMQLAFTALPQKMNLINSLFLAIALVIALTIYKNRLLLYESFLYSRQLAYIKNNNKLIFNPIKEAFSRGIINPKNF